MDFFKVGTREYMDELDAQSDIEDAENFEKNLINAYDKSLDICLNNRAPLRAAKAHKVLFSHSGKDYIFSRGLKKEIFDNAEVIKALKNKFNESDGSDYLITLVIKETKEDMISCLNSSKFYKEAKKLSAGTNKKIIKILWLDPKKSIKPPCELRVAIADTFRDVLKQIIVEPYEGSQYVKDIATFGLFNSQCIRLRTDKNNDHNSDAVINCGRPEGIINDTYKLFQYLEGQSVTLKNYTH